MLEATFFNVENQEKGVVVCEELTEHGGKVMCCHEKIASPIRFAHRSGSD